MNKNKDKINKNFLDAAKTVLKEKYIAIKYLYQEKYLVTNLTFQTQLP